MRSSGELGKQFPSASSLCAQLKNLLPVHTDIYEPPSVAP